MSTKSIELIRLVAHALGDLNDLAVFVGGATMPFYIPEVYWPQARVTEDIDLVLKLMGRVENWAAEEKLRERGFVNDMSKGAPICRWKYKDLKVDVMSPDGEIFGFTNKWYKEGIEKAVSLNSPFPEVKILSFPYFLATKIEAFEGRGGDDYLASSDMEDIISVLETHPKTSIKSSITESSVELRLYLKNKIKALRGNSDFIDALPGAVFNRINPDEACKSLYSAMDLILETFLTLEKMDKK